MILSALFHYRDKKSPDKLGRYPGDFHIKPFPERRYLWTSRILAIFAVLSFCLTIMLVMILYLLIPQQTAKPIFYVSDNDLYHLEGAQPLQTSASYRDLLSEKYITDYIKMRHAIPISSADLFYRWDTNSLFYWYSGLRNYYQFVNNLDNDQLKLFIRLKMRRQVEIDWIKKLTGNLWAAQFRTMTSTKDMPEPDTIIWRAYLRISYLEFDRYEDIEKDDRDKLNYTSNPFGFKVINYSVAYAGKPEKTDDYLTAAKKVFENLEDVIR